MESSVLRVVFGRAVKYHAGKKYHFYIKPDRSYIKWNVTPFPQQQNGEFLNINFDEKNPDDNLENMKVPKELLYKVYIMRCASNFQVDCTAPGGMATDFNYWDRALSDKELRDWTTCK